MGGLGCPPRDSVIMLVNEDKRGEWRSRVNPEFRNCFMSEKKLVPLQEEKRDMSKEKNKGSRYPSSA